MKTTTSTTTTGSLETTSELLASLHNDRAGTLAALANAPFRITSAPVNVRDFWQLFDDSVYPDGTVDVNTFIGASSGSVVQFVDPITFGTAIAVGGLLVAAFGAGYMVGKDMADTDDADDEAAADNADDEATPEGANPESSDRLGEQSIMTLEPGRRGIELRVATIPTMPRATDISAQRLLSRLKVDRAATLEWLRTRREWRIVMAPIPTETVWSFIDSSVSPDGTLQLSAPDSPSASSIASMEPTYLGTAAAIALLAVGTLAVFGVGVAVGYVVNDNEAPGSETEPATDDTNAGGSDTGDTGGTGHDDNDSAGHGGDDAGGAGAFMGTAVLRPGEPGAVNLAVRLAPAQTQPMTPR